MKRHEILFGIIKLPLEFALVFGAFFVAKNIRESAFVLQEFHLRFWNISFHTLGMFALVGAVFYVAVFAWENLYAIKISEPIGKELLQTVTALLLWFLLFIATVYLANGYVYHNEIPRLIIFFALVFATVAISAERTLLYVIKRHLLQKGKLQKRRAILLLKDPETETVEDIKDSGTYEIAGYANAEK